ncbi:MAG: 3-isopropylmalate dehydratase small subunit, partial [Rhodospirillaceae bacterium]|nr:3-isopropylmalate dehydratase small subunit [Rhodospirillaceae bacterium]
GILPIKVTPEQLELLFDDADRGSNATLTVNLESQEITGPDGGVINFEMDPFRKQCLLEGLDDIGQTLQRKGRIDDFEERQKAGQPWLYSAAAE